ncbi:hypothetical protein CHINAEXTREME_13155 [Halobiforma lacisalsi AJ5]|uniref:Uncharacterized protein n=1 Tax=Natronobacterium lacisalsi AJ5 TaxID=358396 RepID=M0LHJ4_NATLA|nr:DUF6517 family protein [Halobiforma lacisalsi]APW98668.1 hypothetical protein CHINAEXTREME_13155 [Halobiforma lacisalsi AJ5]EMA32538.1 hypothetical protein C445_10492 [Halobiforma lacisalsi AJ5]
MTLSRRSLLAAGATGTLALTAGCLDFALGNAPLEFTAERAAPSAAALEETGYTEDDVDEQSFEETVEVGGLEREVQASIWASVYTKDREFEGQSHEASVFAAVSVPAMEQFGYSFNPLDGLSNGELLDEFLSQLETDGNQLEDLSHEETFQLPILGEGRDVDVFVGETEFQGRTVDVDVVITSFAHEGDLLVLLGSYPEPFSDESANVEVLMESIDHPV